MTGVLADTHAVLWYLYDAAQLSPSAREALEEAVASGEGIRLSAISLVEIAYLVDKGRLQQGTAEQIDAALREDRSVLVVAPVDLAVARALRDIPRDLVPDMPDRIIAATALHLGLPLVTRDQRIRAAEIETIW